MESKQVNTDEGKFILSLLNGNCTFWKNILENEKYFFNKLVLSDSAE